MEDLALINRHGGNSQAAQILTHTEKFLVCVAIGTN